MTKRVLLIAAVIIAVVILIMIVRALLLLKDTGDFRKYWQQRAANQTIDNALIYVALGDSTAQGIGASRPEKGYVGLVADYLTHKTNRPIQIINISVSGAKVQDVIDHQLPQLSSYPKPDIVTIEIGANDMLDYDQEAFTKSCKELLPLLPENTVISNLPSFSSGRLKRLNPAVVQANRVLGTLIDKSTLTLVDLYEETNNLGLRDFAPDFFHPNDRSYKKWATAFISGVEQKL